MQSASRPTWAEVSLSTLRHNLRLIREKVTDRAEVCAVVKADAYGHGAVECARALEAEGARWLGVTSPEEGAALRAAGITTRILVMAGFWRGQEPEVVRHKLTPVLWHAEQVRAIDEAAAAARCGQVALHLKVNTGMARLGAEFEEIPDLAALIKRSEHVFLEGLCTHLASSEVVDSKHLAEQQTRFERAAALVVESGLSPLYHHMANSAAIAAHPGTWKNMVRPGISLYGYYLPFAQQSGAVVEPSPELPVKPVLAWKTRIIALRDVAAGQPLGYSGAYVASAPAQIAVLPVGYADGLSRKLSSRGRVLIRDQYAPIVGNVSMDLTLVDVTNIDGAGVGDEVILIGAGKRNRITAWEHASLAGTIPYEVLCNISRRVPRVYKE